MWIKAKDGKLTDVVFQVNEGPDIIQCSQGDIGSDVAIFRDPLLFQNEGNDGQYHPHQGQHATCLSRSSQALVQCNTREEVQSGSPICFGHFGTCTSIS